MNLREQLIREAIAHEENLDIQALLRSSFDVLKDCQIYVGKVSLCIFGPLLKLKNGRPAIVMIRRSNISTHDVGRGTIPFKDQILAKNHNFMRSLLRGVLGVLPHAQIDVPGLSDTSAITLSEKLTPIMLEAVVRHVMAYTTTETSLYVHYMKGEREFCGHQLPDGLVVNGVLPYLMDTPSTKDKRDRSVSPQELINEGLVAPLQYELIRASNFEAFKQVFAHLDSKGIMLVDTKTEYGIDATGKVRLMDELFTMDSSRFARKDAQRASQGLHQPMESLSKEFARGFSKGDSPYTLEERVLIALRYWEGIELLTDSEFIPDMRPMKERILSGVEAALEFCN